MLMSVSSMKTHTLNTAATPARVQFGSVNREKGAADIQRLFGNRPKTFQYSEELLADRELDAVMIATGDHQHARILAEVVRAGKEIPKHKAKGEIIVHCLEGRVAFTALGKTQVLEAGKLCEASLCYTGNLSDPGEKKYTLDYYLKLAREWTEARVAIISKRRKRKARLRHR